MISGYLQSGKDTVANYLVKEYKYKRLAFADILKDDVSKIYSIERQLLDTTEGKKNFNTVYKKSNRQILIDHGCDKRKIDPNYWVDKVIDKLKNTKENYVVSDWRFENEYNRIKEKTREKIITIRINRFDKSDINDISETSLDNFNFDYTLSNKGTIDELYTKVRELVIFFVNNK